MRLKVFGICVFGCLVMYVTANECNLETLVQLNEFTQTVCVNIIKITEKMSAVCENVIEQQKSWLLAEIEKIKSLKL